MYILLTLTKIGTLAPNKYTRNVRREKRGASLVRGARARADSARLTPARSSATLRFVATAGCGALADERRLVGGRGRRLSADAKRSASPSGSAAPPTRDASASGRQRVNVPAVRRPRGRSANGYACLTPACSSPLSLRSAPPVAARSPDERRGVAGDGAAQNTGCEASQVLRHRFWFRASVGRVAAKQV
jgi:hypothetical protein